MPSSSAAFRTPAGSSGSPSFVLGDPVRLGLPDRLELLCLLCVAAVIALPLRGLYAATGSTMEEAFMLVFPERLVAGDVPNVDFLHLYGPGSLDVLAGWYGLFGHSLASERTFGLLQHVGIIAGIYVLTKAWGRVAATTCAISCTLLVLTPIGLSALAWEGAVALGLWSVVFALRAGQLRAGQLRVGRATPVGRRMPTGVHDPVVRCAIAAGVLAGLALSFRPDLIVALALAHLWLLVRTRTSWRSIGSGLGLGAGVIVGLIPLLVHLGMAGLSKSFTGMVLDPVVHLRPGRELPRPPSWSVAQGALQAVAEGQPPWWRFPALGVSRQLFLWFFAMIAVAVMNVAIARRSLADARSAARPDGGLGQPSTRSGRAVVLMAGSLFGLGMVQQGLQRPDSTHLAWVTCICFSLLPVALIEVFQRRLRGWGPTRHRLLAIGAIAATFFVICPFFTFRAYVLHSRVSVGDLRVPFEVRRDGNGRQFWVGDFFVGEASNEVVADLGRLSKPGERLIVGPADLARTIYSDVMFYYLFPELTPATYFIEMDPGLADEQGSRLADDVRSADWLILTNFWTGWNEPNSSSERGSDDPNQVVANDFCLVQAYPRAPDPRYPSSDSLVLLYRRCDRGTGVSPADVGLVSARQRAAGN